MVLSTLSFTFGSALVTSTATVLVERLVRGVAGVAPASAVCVPGLSVFAASASVPAPLVMVAVPSAVPPSVTVTVPEAVAGLTVIASDPAVP